jgi:RimJ/RimL family protein N-acetyltransferase
VIYELPRSCFSIAAPLFEAAWFDRAYIDAAFEGRQHARIFVDDLRRPRAALMSRTYDYYCAGSAESRVLRQFIADAPAEAGIFEALYGYVPIGEAWKEALLEDHGGKLAIIDRRCFTYNETTIATAAQPDGAALRRIDRQLAERVDAELDETIGLLWGGYDRFLAGGFGFCTLSDDAIASVAFTGAVSAREANIFVATAEPFRRRGLATRTCATFIAHCLARGLTPTWDSDAENAASVALARSLGFQEQRPFYELSLPQRMKLTLSHGVWAKQESPTPPTIVTFTRIAR